jgi:hypothetical protein
MEPAPSRIPPRLRIDLPLIRFGRERMVPGSWARLSVTRIVRGALTASFRQGHNLRLHPLHAHPTMGATASKGVYLVNPVRIPLRMVRVFRQGRPQSGPPALMTAANPDSHSRRSSRLSELWIVRAFALRRLLGRSGKICLSHPDGRLQSLQDR